MLTLSCPPSLFPPPLPPPPFFAPHPPSPTPHSFLSVFPAQFILCRPSSFSSVVFRLSISSSVYSLRPAEVLPEVPFLLLSFVFRSQVLSILYAQQKSFLQFPFCCYLLCLSISSSFYSLRPAEILPEVSFLVLSFVSRSQVLSILYAQQKSFLKLLFLCYLSSLGLKFCVFSTPSRRPSWS